MKSAPTDIERLHKVALGELRGRGVGKTYKLCCDVISALHLDEKSIAVILPKPQWVEHVRPMLKELLQENGFEIEREFYSDILLCNGGKIIFYSAMSSYVNKDLSLIDGYHGAIVDFREEERLLRKEAMAEHHFQYLLEGMKHSPKMRQAPLYGIGFG